MPEAIPVVRDEGLIGPIYRNIYDSIRSSILNGTIRSGERLPATRAFSNDFGVSRMTVVNAYEQLIAEGYLETRRGSGTFVARALPETFLTIDRLSATSPETIKTPDRQLSSVGRHLSLNSASILANESATGFRPFQHGLVSLDDFPFPIWQKMLSQIAQIPLRTLLMKSGALGYMPLREAVAAHLRAARGVNCEPGNIVITDGAQQALDLVARLFVGPGDVVWMDNPGYRGALGAFGAAGANVLPVGLDGEGFDLNLAVKKHPIAKMIYTTPSHQFPLGGSMSIGRRLEILEWADKHGALIIEDDYDSEFRYEGRPLASMQGLDRNGRVIYIGTFSKTIFSALRLGCMVVPTDLIPLFETARIVTDGHSSLIDQAVLAKFMVDGHFGRHVRRMRKLYAERQRVFIRLARKYLDRIEFETAPSGMHLVGWLPEGISDQDVSLRMSHRGVRAAPLSDYAIERPKRGGLLFGYAGFSEREMTDALKRIADLPIG
ncbi:MAG: PLP-dependent aminotransferase family protein [Pyrinomonadaceae bacterium]